MASSTQISLIETPSALAISYSTDAGTRVLCCSYSHTEFGFTANLVPKLFERHPSLQTYLAYSQAHAVPLFRCERIYHAPSFTVNECICIAFSMLIRGIFSV